MKRSRGVLLALSTAVVLLAGCVAYVPVQPAPRAAHWVPGHYNYAGYWVQGHWAY